MMNTASGIRLEKIVHAYENKLVLNEVSHDFIDNKITAVLGRSGSGKTTLLKTINGIVKPERGRVTVFDQPIDYDNIHATRLKMGYVVQQVGLFPHLTILENMSILARIAKSESKYVQSRISYLMNLVQLPNTYLNKYPHQLSGGEQQRVGLCRAMFLNPPVMLMDEPFASLDNETKESIYQDLITSQKTEPRTIILVTHSESEALILADHFIWLKEGKIVESGDRQKLKILFTEAIVE
jgi:osmoprotectant transport system ATP-binding protein